MLAESPSVTNGCSSEASISSVRHDPYFASSYLDAVGGTSADVNTAVGNAGAALLIVNITDTKNWLQENNWDVPVGSADAGAFMNNEILAAVDYGVCERY